MSPREALTAAVKIGATGRGIEKVFQSLGLRSAFKNYQNFPAEICVSVNDAIVHGIPNEVPFKENDIVKVDYGWYGDDNLITDEALTVQLGEESLLVRATREALAAGVLQARVGNSVGDISNAVAEVAEKYNLGIVREFVGHGVGLRLHMDPQIPNYRTEKRGPKLKRGMRLAIEPMFTETQTEVVIDPVDQWTVRTKNGCLSAHFEETVVVK